jgi:uncharacterized protein YxjI
MLTTCPECAKKLSVKDESACKRVQCPGCGAIFVAAASTEEATVEPAPALKRERVPVAAGRRATPELKTPPRQEDIEPEEMELEETETEVIEEPEENPGDGVLDRNKFVVKQQAKMFSAKQAYDIVDPASGETLASAKVKTSLMATLLALFMGKDKMSLTLEVRDTDGALLFSVRRSGLLFKKVRLLDHKGQVVGQYKAKMLSLTGGFHVYDKAGKHFAEIKGKMFKSEYTILAPKGGAEMGKVSKKWGGMSRELLSGAGTFGVEIAPAYSENATVKMLILGAAIAINAIFKKKSGKGGGDEGEDDGGDE